jgi:hypothetical protein
VVAPLIAITELAFNDAHAKVNPTVKELQARR